MNSKKSIQFLYIIKKSVQSSIKTSKVSTTLGVFSPHNIQFGLLILGITFLSFSSSSSFSTKNLSEGRTYYLNGLTGSDVNDGLSPQSAWQSLQKASQVDLRPGDKILLSKGCTFYGKLQMNGGGSESDPVIVSAYDPKSGNTSLPVINAKGYLAAIQIENGKNIKISNLELTSDAGTPEEPQACTERYGVLITASEPGIYPNLKLEKLRIHNIFATENIESNGQNLTSNMGMGIVITMQNKDAIIKNVRVEDCAIEMTGHTGIRIFGWGDKSDTTWLDNVTIVNNRLTHIGGPGMVPGRCQHVLVRGNMVDHSGSSIDPRMHARGSGIWPWTCNNVLIEKNKLMHARGKNDSCGAHIDFNCKNVVVQYNLSLDNEGGFVEILGNNHNCAYRYNISINDGFRVKGENGAQNDGKILWTSGYVGHGNKRTGPFNSYIYNNTIFVKEGSRSCFSFEKTTEGLLIANNIFHVLGKTLHVQGGQEIFENELSQSIPNVVFTNNLYINAAVLPADLPVKDINPYIGNPEFKNGGGDDPHNYVPENSKLIKDKGIRIEKIPGDKIGLTIGLGVELDYFGHSINGLPDLGAIEIQ